MDKERLEDLKKRLHTAIDSVIYNYSLSQGQKENISYWNMLEEKQYISNLLALIN